MAVAGGTLAQVWRKAPEAAVLPEESRSAAVGSGLVAAAAVVGQKPFVEESWGPCDDSQETVGRGEAGTDAALRTEIDEAERSVQESYQRRSCT